MGDFIVSDDDIDDADSDRGSDADVCDSASPLQVMHSPASEKENKPFSNMLAFMYLTFTC